MKINSFVFALLGLSMLGMSAYLLFKEQSFLAGAVSVNGMVAQMQTALNPDQAIIYCPVIAFQIPEDEKTYFTTSPCHAPAVYTIGEHVSLFYDPLDPRRAQVQDFESQYAVPALCAFIGLPFFLLGAWGLWSTSKV